MSILSTNSIKALRETFPFVVIGSGLFGLTMAHLIAEYLGKPVLILEKRDHIGGNAWSHIDPKSNIEVHDYGTHIFHTNNKQVWDFLNQFTKFNNYTHHVWSNFQNSLYSIPINLSTLNQFFGKVLTPSQATELIESETKQYRNRKLENFEDAALAAIGLNLYNAFIEGYTAKQWQTDPKKLPIEIFTRLPVRKNLDTRYFNDVYQGQPIDGYFSMINKIIDHPLIQIETNFDGLEIINELSIDQILIYTGPLDQYFNYIHGRLSWRTLDFKFENLDVDDFQGAAVINFPDRSFPYTRIHEFHHLNPERAKISGKTIIAKEFSRFSEGNDEPFYPVNAIDDRQALKLYRKKATELKNVIFGGRLGTYQYLDMHMAIASAISVFNNQISLRN